MVFAMLLFSQPGANANADADADADAERTCWLRGVPACRDANEKWEICWKSEKFDPKSEKLARARR